MGEVDQRVYRNVHTVYYVQRAVESSIIAEPCSVCIFYECTYED